MCLALYANGVLRLWNMLDARCIFKKKVGIDDEESSSGEEESNSDDNIQKTIAQKYINKPEIVKWEPKIS